MPLLFTLLLLLIRGVGGKLKLLTLAVGLPPPEGTGKP
jgi:hypothetical protein